MAELPPVPAWRQALRRAEIDPTAKLVGLVLSTYMSGAGRAQVSRSTLARGCGFGSIDPVLRAVQRLEQAGLLGVDRPTGEGQAASRYRAQTGSWSATPNGPGRVADQLPEGSLHSVRRVAGEQREVEDLEGQSAGLGARAEGGTVKPGGEGDGAEGPRSAAEAAAAFRAALGQKPQPRRDP